jgi:hypothetical protein
LKARTPIKPHAKRSGYAQKYGPGPVREKLLSGSDENARERRVIHDDRVLDRHAVGQLLGIGASQRHVFEVSAPTHRWRNIPHQH